MSQAARVVLLAPHTDEADYAEGEWRPYYERMRAPLEAAGAVAEARPWNAAGDLTGADAVLALMVWAYHRRPAEWAEALDRWQADGVRLFNSAALMRWNTDKAYLLDLAARGAPVVPTVSVEAPSADAIEAARQALGGGEVVVKPRTSASSEGVFRLAPGAAPAVMPTVPVLVQPFQTAVGGEGELSLYHFNGEPAHAVRKVARPGDFRVQPDFGGTMTRIDPPAEAREAARAVLDAVGEPLLYARVDMIRGEDGTFQLMELEAIEPQLYLDQAPEMSSMFAEAVLAAARR